MSYMQRATCGVGALLLSLLPSTSTAQPAPAEQPPAAAPQDPATPPPSVTRRPGVKAPADEVDPELEGAADDTAGAAEDSPGATAPAPGDAVPSNAPPDVVQEDAAAADAKVFTGLRGKVVDANTGEGLIEAQIKVVKGGTQSTLTDVDGSFELALPPGNYEIRVFTALYTGQRFQLEVEAGKPETLEVKLTTEEGATEEVVVVATPDTATAAVEIMRRRKRAAVSDAISAEQISRSPDSNASDAAKRVVGATIQDSRYVVIRGLGGRYSLTLLNGVPLPSPDPDMPAAPLDLFPAALLANLTVTKTFSADMPGNFAGGALSIESRSFPADFTFKVRAGTGYDSETTLRSSNSYEGGSFDAFGYDDGTRSLPSAIPTDRRAADGIPAEERNAQAASFENNWGVESSDAVPSGTVGVTLGDTLRAANQRVGYLANVNFSNSRQTRRSSIAEEGADDGMGGLIPSTLQLEDFQTSQRATLSGLLTAGWTPAPPHRVNVVGLYTHGADDIASSVEGRDSNDNLIRRSRLRFIEREMVFGQLFGEHDLFGGKVQIGWQGNIARVSQDDPDGRELLFVQSASDGRYGIGQGAGAAERIFNVLSDTTGGGGLDITVPLPFVRLRAGGSILASSREYRTRRFHFEVSSDDLRYQPVDQAFAPGNMGMGISFREDTRADDGYDGERSVLGGYALADFASWDPLRIVAGVRVEQSDLDITLASDVVAAPPMAQVTSYSETSVLPTGSVLYGVTKNMALRAAYAMTVARPNFREISPAVYFDYSRRRAFSGNPALVESTIHNADLRWEAYLGPTEILAASLFYKHFIDPIERTTESAGSGQNISYSNEDSADSYGVELEARVSLGRVLPALSDFTLGANLSLIESAIDIGGQANTTGIERPLQGQSPFVANIGLGYDLARTKTQVDLLYNVAGRRIEEVGTAGAGDVYEEAFHRLDLSVSQKISDQLKLKLSGTNLLNRRVVFTQSGVDVLAYQIGVGALASLELSVE
jgi:hypothetical protein